MLCSKVSTIKNPTGFSRGSMSVDNTHNLSTLPDVPDPKPFEDFLYRVRMEQVKDEMDGIE
jgi:hypothetical protein